MGGHQYDAGKVLAAFVEALDAFQVEVVGRLVKYHEVGLLQHHATEHATHFFTSAQYICFLHDIIAAEQHFTEKAA